MQSPATYTAYPAARLCPINKPVRRIQSASANGATAWARHGRGRGRPRSGGDSVLDIRDRFFRRCPSLMQPGRSGDRRQKAAALLGRRASKHARRRRCGCVLRGALSRAPQDDEAGNRASPIKGQRLDKRLQMSYNPRISPLTRTPAGDTGRRSGSGSRGRRLVTVAPGRLRQDTPGRHDDRSAGAISLGWDSKARVTPASDESKAGPPASRKNALRCARSFEPSGLRALSRPGKSRGSS